MRDTVYANLAKSLSSMITSLPHKPEAILMISAHWEEDVFTVQGQEQPGMIYDYYGFPEHTYSVQYPSKGHPVLAQRIQKLLLNKGLPTGLDLHRGYDHGMYAPMALIAPEADIPVLQLSLKMGLEPLIHVQAGRALTPLREERVLIVGSGLSYHNLRAFGPLGREASCNFDRWLQQTVLQFTGQERTDRLLHWAQAPSAREAHPREEHLLPLMVVSGAAESERGSCVYHENDFAGSITVSSFCLGSS